MADVIAIVANVVTTIKQLECINIVADVIATWSADVIANVADVIATYFIVCWLMLLPWWYMLKPHRVMLIWQMLKPFVADVITTVSSYLKFSSEMLSRTSSQICGRWYLPMFLLRDGLLSHS